MSTAVIEEIVKKANKMTASERRNLIDRLKEVSKSIASSAVATGTTTKKGYVSPNTEWMRDYSHNYPGMHVALKDGKLIATGRTIKEADMAARSFGVDRPLLAYVPREDEELWGGW